MQIQRLIKADEADIAGYPDNLCAGLFPIALKLLGKAV
jgi:hypothetical protein